MVTSEVTQRAGREALNYTVQRGASTALLLAARAGDAESIRLLAAAGADAVLAASVFHFGDLTIGQVKDAMRAEGVVVR